MFIHPPTAELIKKNWKKYFGNESLCEKRRHFPPHKIANFARAVAPVIETTYSGQELLGPAQNLKTLYTHLSTLPGREFSKSRNINKYKESEISHLNFLLGQILLFRGGILYLLLQE